MSGTGRTAAEQHGAPAAPVSLADVRRTATAVLPPGVSDFIDGGSGTETTLSANRIAFDEVALLPRVLAGVSVADTAARLVGTDASMPVAVAPMAYQRLVHDEGELAAARAARSAGVPFVASTLSSHRIEDIAAVGATTWFQLYWLRDENTVRELVRRAEESGCRALMVTVDVPAMGRRRRDVRNGFALPQDVRAANVDGGGATSAQVRANGVSAVAVHTADAFEPGLTWRDVARLRRWTELPVLVKGILDPRDAWLAVEAGVDGVVVSNHGGRQLDGAVPSVDALPAVVDAVGGGCQVLLDSGVRSGTDVLRALALGASGVLVGRPVLWGLAAGGERGVAQVLSLLHTELSNDMMLAGCRDVAAAGELSTARSNRGSGAS